MNEQKRNDKESIICQAKVSLSTVFKAKKNVGGFYRKIAF